MDPDFRELEREHDERLADAAGEASSRAAGECPDCLGSGYETNDPDDFRACVSCGGTGERR